MSDGGSTIANCMCPIYSFDMDGDRAPIGDDLEVVRVTDEQQWGMPTRLWAPPFGAPSCAFVRPIRVNDTMALGHARMSAQRDIAQAVTALRLLKEGFFACGHVMARMQSTDGAAGVGIMSAAYVAPVRRTPTFHLCGDELGEVARLLGLCTQSVHKDRLGLAIRRLNFTYDRSRPTDRLIDATIALESVLLIGIRDELKYRLAQRGALLLGHDGPSRVDVYGLLRAAYDARSDLVHGSADDPKTVKVQKHDGPDEQAFPLFVSNVEDCLRSVIRALLRAPEGQKLRVYVDALDSAALTGRYGGST